MNQVEVMQWMAGAYLCGCALALVLSLRDHDNALQVVVYAATLLGFYAVFGGQARHWHWLWYMLNAGTDFFIILCALLIRARSSAVVAGFGVVALVTDLVYAIASESGHRLPGVGYFYISNIVLALQVSAMIVFSGGVAAGVTWCRRAITKWQQQREKTWTQHRFNRS